VTEIEVLSAPAGIVFMLLAKTPPTPRCLPSPASAVGEKYGRPRPSTKVTLSLLRRSR
jgi:hypothetical protein